MQYRLRTLLIVLALAPPVLAGAWFGAMALGSRQKLTRAAETNPFAKLIDEIEEVQRTRTPRDNPDGLEIIIVHGD